MHYRRAPFRAAASLPINIVFPLVFSLNPRVLLERGFEYMQVKQNRVLVNVLFKWDCAVKVPISLILIIEFRILQNIFAEFYIKPTVDRSYFILCL